MTEFNKTLYKKDSKGKLRILTITADSGTVNQVSGLMDGKLTARPSQCKGKNIGRANETTKEEQAVLEAESKYTKKLREGYFTTQEEAMNSVVVSPMLAKKFEEQEKNIIYPCMVQPKLDGMRCLAVIKEGKVELFSRGNKQILTMNHIIKALEGINLSNCIIDGELYAHGLSFQENMKLLKKYRKGESEKVKFNVYDMVSDDEFRLRVSELVELDLYSPHITYVPTITVINREDIDEMNRLYLKQGYEGTMVRWGDAGYKMGGRSANLLKMKIFIDEAYKVVGVDPSEKDPAQGVVRCYCPKTGEQFSAGMKFSHKDREEILANKENYIGQIAEIRFFEFTDSGLPRFPVCHGFRLDK